GPFTLDRIPERIRATLVYAFGQEKFIRPEVAIVKERTAGWLHFVVFWGFIILGIQIIMMFGRAFSDTFYPFPFTPALLGKPYWLVRDIFEAAVFLCILILLARWLVTQPRRLFGFPPAEGRHRHHSHWEAYLILGCIGMITFSGPIYDGSRLLAHGVEGFVGEARWEPFSYLMSRILASLGGPAFVDSAGNVAWWMHNLAGLVMLNFLPVPKPFHAITPPSPKPFTSSPRLPKSSSRSWNRSGSSPSQSMTRTPSATARRASTSSPGSRSSTCSAAPRAAGARRSAPPPPPASRSRPGSSSSTCATTSTSTRTR